MDTYNQGYKSIWKIVIIVGFTITIAFILWWLYRSQFPVFHGISGSTVIVFESNGESGKQLYAMSPDGAQTTRLTYHLHQTGWFGTSFGAYFEDLVINQNPSIGPAMRGFYYLSNFSPENGYQWYYLSLDGGKAQHISTGLPDNLNTSISLNGQFLVHRTSEGDLYLYDVLTHEELCINCERENGAVYSLPKWSPNGQRLVLSVSSDTKNEGHIHVYEIATRQMTQLTRGFDTRYIEPAWSPDGKQIAYTGGEQTTEQTTPRRNIYIMNADGSNPRQLTQSGADRNPAWSPDGQQIVFQSQRGNRVSKPDGIATDLFRIDIDGTDEIRLIGNSGSAHYTNPVWVVVP